MSDEIQEPELLERACRAGEPVSTHQLKRFRDAGQCRDRALFTSKARAGRGRSILRGRPSS